MGPLVVVGITGLEPPLPASLHLLHVGKLSGTVSEGWL